MQQPWWFSIISALIGAGVIAILAYLRQRALQHEAQEHEEKLQIKSALLDRNLDEVYQFIQTDGLVELLGFFKDHSSPREFLDHLSRLSTMDQHFDRMGHDFQGLKSELESMRGMLSERLFNPVTARIHDGIESNRTFTSRLKEKSESKTYLKSHWLDIEMVQHVLASETSIFIESGSTLAYCMLSIVDNMQKFRTSGKPLCVCTNNVAIYMMLLFQKHFNPVLLPGKPDNPYAATFGDIGGDGQHGDLIKEFLEEYGVNVLFTTASYLDIDYGPHVGSVQNHAMKRILNDYANSPDHERINILMIVAEKINRDVEGGRISEKCKLIFDPERMENMDPVVLDRTRKAWEAHLRRPNNYIISGSSDTSLCTSKLDDFTRQHNMHPFILQAGGGLLFKLSSI